MKRLLAIFLLFCSLQLVAQETKLFVGARAGLNTSVSLQNVDMTGFTIVGRYTGFHLGPTFYFEPKEFLGFNSGIFFNSTGWVDNLGQLSDTILYRKDVFKNIQLPFTVSLKLGVGEVARIIIEAGGYGNYALSGYTDFKDLTGEIHTQSVQWAKFGEAPDPNDFSYRKMNVGGIIGFAFQSKFFKVGASYNVGLFDVTKNELVIHNHMWQFYVVARTF